MRRVESWWTIASPDPRVVQDAFSGYFLYQEDETGRLFYRDVKGMSEDGLGGPVYTEDDSDDTFYVWDVELEVDPHTEHAYYRDVRGTPDDTDDDVFYEWHAGDGAGAVVCLRRRLCGPAACWRDPRNPLGERASDTGQTHAVTINSDLFDVTDYRYRFLTPSSAPTAEDPLYVLDTLTRTIVRF